MQSSSSNGRRPRKATCHRRGSRCGWSTTVRLGCCRSRAQKNPCSNGLFGVLTLALDTATDVATVTLVEDGRVLGERRSRAVRVLADAHELLAEAGRTPQELDRLVVGTGPGSFTGTRIGLAAVRGLALALDLPT